MCIDILKWSEAQNICVLHVHRDGGLKRGKVKEVFKEEQQKLYSKVLVGSSEDRSRSWRDAAVCLTSHMLLGAHSESLDPQRMQCGPRLALSWTCSYWTVELNWWSHCELVGKVCCQTLGSLLRLRSFCSIAWKCLWQSIPGLTMISVWSESYTWHTCYFFSLHSLLVLNICAVTIMHEVPGEEWVEEFEIIYLSL